MYGSHEPVCFPKTLAGFNGKYKRALAFTLDIRVRMISFLSAGRPLGGKIRYNEHEEHSCKLAGSKNDAARTPNASLHNAHVPGGSRNRAVNHL
jgi:hypothetical protein